MADLPEASVSIDDEGGALAGGTDIVTVLACVAQNADVTPRLFSSTKALLAKHLYAAGIDYCAMHFEETGKPVLFVGLPIVTAGTIGRIVQTGNTGSSVVSAAADTSGILEEVDGVITCETGGTIGTNGIAIGVSLDGGRTKKVVRLGTANSYTLPYVGLVLSFGAGTLVAGDTVLTFSTTAPRPDQAGIAAARAALVAQQKQARSWLTTWDLNVAQDATDILTQANAYADTDTRYVYARAQARDRKHYASMSKVVAKMTGAPSLTFHEVGGTGDTITRSAGSWISDGFMVNDWINVAGSASNNVAGQITGVSATVLTLGTTDLADEGPVGNCTVTATPTLTFAEVGVTGDTITRSRGSWLDDGFAVGDTVTITGTSSNNVSGPIAGLTATVLTFGTTDLAAEVLSTSTATIVAGELDVDWVTSIANAFSTITSQRRIDIGAGRGRKSSYIHGWNLRRPAAWATSIREYQHDVQIPTWRKADGPLFGWSLLDADGSTAEHDERSDGGLLAERFTCLRSYANGPLGTFVALSMTRADETSLLSRTHNMAVANIASSVVQSETENAIGYVLELNTDGTGTEASLKVLEERVNSALAINLRQNGPEGVRASGATWTASRTDVLNSPGAILNGTLNLLLNGTLEKIATRIRVQTGG